MKAAKTITVAVAVLGLGAGCLGRSEDFVDGRTASLQPPEPSGLPIVPHRRWEEAPAGCEGRLGPDMVYGVPDGAPSLLVAFRSADHDEIACVDSRAAIRSELLAIGAEDSWETLSADYGDGPSPADAFDPESAVEVDREHAEGDPSPQPSKPSGSSGDASSDPSPQPSEPDTDGTSSDAAEGDPSPQPSIPEADLADAMVDEMESGDSSGEMTAEDGSSTSS